MSDELRNYVLQAKSEVETYAALSDLKEKQRKIREEQR